MDLTLYSFFQSSTSYRVRIALALKGLPYDYAAVDIRIGAHRDAAFVGEINPSAGVPALVVREGGEAVTLGQSLAIIDYLDQIHPKPRLIPLEPLARARVLEFANLIACDIHPVNNLRVLRYLQGELGLTDAQRDAWYKHWIAEGLAGAERLLAHYGAGPYCFGDAPSLADCCLVPQIANAERMKCPLDAYPRVMAAARHARSQPAFAAAAPAVQPDFAQ